jgi:hypothetical protein
MTDQGTQIGIVDSRYLTYLPLWVRISALGSFSLVLLLSSASAFYFLTKERSDLLIFSLAVAQTAATVFFIVVLVLFSQRDANIRSYMGKSEEFLTLHLYRALQRISVPSQGVHKFHVSDTGRKDLFGRLFTLSSEAVTFQLWVGLNVYRIFVVYFVKSDGGEDFSARAEKVFKFTFGVATAVGFVPHYEVANINGEPVLSIWLTARTQEDLLTNPAAKLFWSQDVAMMTESFVRTALRNGLVVQTMASPGPL